MFNDNENLEKLEHWDRKIEEMHYVSDRIGWDLGDETRKQVSSSSSSFCHEIVLPLGSRIS